MSRTCTARSQAFQPTPGMPADVFIKTGERTFFDYIMRPVLGQLLPRLPRELSAGKPAMSLLWKTTRPVIPEADAQRRLSGMQTQMPSPLLDPGSPEIARLRDPLAGMTRVARSALPLFRES